MQPGLKEQLSNKHPLYLLANVINWEMFKESFKKHYKENLGRPAKPIRLMTSLLMLKHIRNLCDESIVAQWAEKQTLRATPNNSKTTQAWVSLQAWNELRGLAYFLQ